MNQVILVGHVGQDPQTKIFTSEKKVCTFNLATVEKYNGQEKTTWHNIVAWGYLADRPVKKGSKVLVIGKLETRSYEKDGVTHYRTEIVAFQLEIITKFSKVNAAETFTESDDPFTKKGLDSEGFTTPPATQSQLTMGTGNNDSSEADDLPF